MSFVILNNKPSVATAPISRVRKPYRKRLTQDQSQRIRRVVQTAFLLLNIYIGAVFVLFVRQFEQYDPQPSIQRPAGIEGWLPIAGLMNLKAALLTGEFPVIHPAAMVLIATFLGLSLLFRKAFCGWLCPVGTLSEWLWKTGRMTFKGNLRLWRWIDIPLRSLKYILLGLFAMGGDHDACAGHRKLPTLPLWSDRRREDAELLPVPERNRRRFHWRRSSAVHLHPEFLVPLSVPIRRTDGSGVSVESVVDQTRPGQVHRLREMREGLSIASAG